MQCLLLRVSVLSVVLFVGACKSTEVVVTGGSVQYQAPYRAPYQAARTKYHDLLHTKLAVRFDWERQHLHGVATLKLQPHCFPQRHLVLDAQGFVVHRVERLGGHVKEALAYTYDGKKLTIDLGKMQEVGVAYWVEVAYTAQPNELEGHKEGSLNGSKGLLFINPDGGDRTKPRQVWTQGEPASNSSWFPTIDAPNQRCTQEVFITVEDRFKTLCNGVLGYSRLNEDQTRTDYWHMDLPHPPYLFMLAVGEFAVVQDVWEDLEVNYYVEPAYEQYAKAIFGHTPEMLEFFSQKLAYPYPWPKYSQVVVRDYLAGAMENTSAAVFSEEFQVDDRALLDSDCDDIIAHELFHHWFGNLVTCESWSHLPLNESFACLGAHIWRAHKYGVDAGDLCLWNTLQGYLREASCKQVNLIRFHYDDVGELFDRHSYNKGALVLHMLRQYLGEEVFFDALGYYLKRHAFSSVGIHQLRRVFEEVTGEDLNWFFDQWFFAAGHPVLKVEHAYDHGVLTLKVWQRQDAQTTPVYKLPLTVNIWTGSEQQRHKIVVEKPYSEFTWALPQQPALVSLDRRTMLLGVIEHAKSPAAYRRLYYQGGDFFAKHEALTYCVNNMGDPGCCQVLQAALQDGFWFFRKMAAAAFKGYKGKDLAAVALLLSELGKSDAKPAVRAAAVCSLASFSNPAQYAAVYKQGMAARSYHLVSTALYAYATTTNEPGKFACLAEFEACDNAKIVLALASYYAEAKQPNKYAWLKAQIARRQGRRSICPLIVVLGKYLAVISNEKNQADGLALLHQLAVGTEKAYVQSAVCEALRHMQQVKGAKALFDVLKANL